MAGGISMPNMGDGESQMMNFILEHMTNILQPIADHVKELQQQALDLQQATGQLTSRADQADQSFEQHNQRLVDCSAGLSQAQTDLERANAGIADAGRKHRTLEIEHNASRECLVRAEEELKTQGNSVGELLRFRKDTDAHLKAIQDKLDDSATQAEKNRNDIGDLKLFTEGLNDRHLEHMASHQESKKLGSKVDQTLRSFMAATDKQNKENSITHVRLDDRTKAAEDGLRQMLTQIQANASQLREKMSTTDDEIRHITSKLLAIEAQNAEWQNDLKGHASEQKGPAGRMQKIEQELAKFSDAITAGQKDNRRRITELSELVAKASSDIGVMDHVQVTHVDHLRRISHRAGDLENNGSKLAGRVDRAEAIVSSLAAAKEDALRRLESHAFDLKQKDAQLGKARADLDSTTQRLDGHDSEFGGNAKALAHIGTRLELAFEYFQGMGRGFRDTHRKVVGGEDGMLPPKSGMAKTLPTIPSANMGRNETTSGGGTGGYSTTSPGGGTRAAWAGPSPTGRASPTGAMTSR